jgi:hypothetical protein
LITLSSFPPLLFFLFSYIHPSSSLYIPTNPFFFTLSPPHHQI